MRPVPHGDGTLDLPAPTRPIAERGAGRATDEADISAGLITRVLTDPAVPAPETLVPRLEALLRC